jgi:hypothetical protein
MLEEYRRQTKEFAGDELEHLPIVKADLPARNIALLLASGIPADYRGIACDWNDERICKLLQK